MKKIVVRLNKDYKVADKDQNIQPEVMVFDSIVGGFAALANKFVEFKDHTNHTFVLSSDSILFVREVEVKEEDTKDKK